MLHIPSMKYYTSHQKIMARYAKKMPDTYRDEIRAWWVFGSGTDLARI
jgi:hypothetical protein